MSIKTWTCVRIMQRMASVIKNTFLIRDSRQCISTVPSRATGLFRSALTRRPIVSCGLLYSCATRWRISIHRLAQNRVVYAGHNAFYFWLVFSINVYYYYYCYYYYCFAFLRVLGFMGFVGSGTCIFVAIIRKLLEASQFCDGFELRW
jgi:hypothetical protein